MKSQAPKIYHSNMKTIKEFAEAIQENKNLPTKLNDLNLEMAAKYGMMSEIAKELQLEKAEFTTNLKFSQEKPLSDSFVNQKWLTTEGGKKEIRLKYEMRALEKMMSAIKSSIVVASYEARNEM